MERKKVQAKATYEEILNNLLIKEGLRTEPAKEQEYVPLFVDDMSPRPRLDNRPLKNNRFMYNQACASLVAKYQPV